MKPRIYRRAGVWRFDHWRGVNRADYIALCKFVTFLNWYENFGKPPLREVA